MTTNATNAPSFTPGPWTVTKWSGSLRVVAPGAAICTVPYDRTPHAPRGGERVEEDARLIAAAPDLLASLRWCLGYFEDLSRQPDVKREYQPDRAELAPLLRALAKAEGTEPAP